MTEQTAEQKKKAAAIIDLALTRQAENDFYTFIQLAWPHVEGGKKFVGGWAIRAMCLPYNSKITTEDGPMYIGAIVTDNYSGNVLSFNHSTKAPEWKPILARMTSPKAPLYDITLSSGIVLTLTDDHPIFVVGRGYARAENIRSGDVVLQAMREEVSQIPRKTAWRVLQSEMLRRFKNIARKTDMSIMWRPKDLGRKVMSRMLCKKHDEWEDSSLHQLRKRGLSNRGGMESYDKKTRRFLQSSMLFYLLFWRKSRWIYRREKTNKICPQLSQGKKTYSCARFKLLFSLFHSWENGCSPYRQGSLQQRDVESCDSLPPMPQSPEGDRRGNFAISECHVVEVKRSLRISEEVYNIEVEGNNNYFAQSILVHNCEHLEEVYYGRILRLSINIPPRCTKSNSVSVLFPVWCWIKNPGMQMLTMSYLDRLAVRDNVKSRRLIKSAWFQNRWGDRFSLALDQDAKERVDNMQGGYRVTAGLDSGITGDGGDLLVIDDGNNVKDQSDIALDNALDVYQNVLPTRFNDFKTGRLINVQQRTSMRDISGYIEAHEKEEFVRLILPMEFEEARRCVTVPLKSTNGLPWQDPRQEEGELLTPDRIGPVELRRLKKALGSEYAIAGQLQQRPAPTEGGMIKRSWFQPWKHESPPKISFIIQAWDTGATAKESSAYSACTTWGMFKDDNQHDCLILLSVWRKKVEFPDLYKAVQRMARDYTATTEDRPVNERNKPDLILVEEKSSGVQLIQTFNKTGITLVGWRPDKYGDKIERVRRVTHLMESGRVFVPYKAPDFLKPKQYADFLISQCAVWPKGDSRDLVDTLSCVLQRVINSGWVLHPLEYQASQDEEWRRENFSNGQTEGFY